MLLYHYYLPISGSPKYKDHTLQSISIGIRFDIYSGTQLLECNCEPRPIHGLYVHNLCHVYLDTNGNIQIEEDETVNCPSSKPIRTVTNTVRIFF